MTVAYVVCVLMFVLGCAIGIDLGRHIEKKDYK